MLLLYPIRKSETTLTGNLEVTCLRNMSVRQLNGVSLTNIAICPLRSLLSTLFASAQKNLALIVSAYNLLVGDESRRERSLPQSHGISHAWNDTTCAGGTF